MKRLYDLWYAIGQRVPNTSGAEFIAVLLNDFDNQFQDTNSQGRYQSLLFEFDSLVKERGLLQNYWSAKSVKTWFEIEAEVKNLISKIKPAIEIEQKEWHEPFGTIGSVGFLLLLSPKRYSTYFDPTFWGFAGEVSDVNVYDVGVLLLELASHRWLLRHGRLKPFDYYRQLLEATEQARNYVGIPQLDVVLTLAVAGVIVKFSGNLELIGSYPYLMEWLGKVFPQLEVSAVNEEQLLAVTTELVNNLAKQMRTATKLMSGALIALSAIQNGTGRPIVAQVSSADGLVRPDGKVLSGSDISYRGHRHPQLLEKSQPAVDALFLIAYENNIKRRYTASDFASADHRHEEYATVEELKDADFLYDGEKFYTADDFALANHIHPEYVPAGQPVYAARKFVNELMGEPLAPIDHDHDGVYLLHSEPAFASYKLGGLYADNFATADHTHPEYVTISQAQALGESINAADDATKGAKGLYTILDAPGTSGDVPVAVHYKFLTVSFSGSYTIDVPNVVFCHVTLVGPSTRASLPTVEYDTDVITGKRTKVRLRTENSVPVTVQVFIGYVPDVSNFVKHNIISPDRVLES